MNDPALSALDPPATRPRGTGTVSPSVSSPVSAQFAGCPGAAASIVPASRISAGKSPGRAWSAPASRRRTRRPASASRAASAQPDVPAPTTTTSQSRSATETQHPGQVQPAHLAGGGPRQVVEPVQGLGPLGRRQPLPRPGTEVARLGGADVGSHHPLAPLLVRKAEHRALHHVGVGVEHRLHLGGVHVHAAGDDQVLAPAVQPDDAVAVDPPPALPPPAGRAAPPAAPPRGPGALPGPPPVLEARPPRHRAPQLAA